MTNILRTKVADYGLTSMIQRLGRDCTPTQFVREYVMNCIEAIARGDGSGRVQVDADWSYYAQTQIHKICFIDNGVGMTADEMREHLNSLSSSGPQKNQFENYGMGAKIASLTRNHVGIIYDSWKGGSGNRILIRYDESSHAYGIAEVRGPDGEALWELPLSDDVKPKIIGDSGTRVTLLGMSPLEDTMAPPDGVAGGRENWIYQYLNTRFFEISPQIDLQVRVGYFRDYSDERHNYTRRVLGQKAILDGHAVASGSVKISDAIVRWWILKENRDGHGREFIKGHTGCICQNEIFELADGRSNRAPGFGILFGREDVVLYVEPLHGYVQDTTRSRVVKSDGTALPWDRWQDEFRGKLPKEIREMQQRLKGATEKESHTASIKERLRSISNLFKISRYRSSASGGVEADPHSVAKSSIGEAKSVSTKGYGGSRDGEGRGPGSIEAYLLSGLKAGGVRASEVNPDNFPTVEWISSAKGNRGAEELDDRAAEYLERDNLIRANGDFQGFTDVIDYFMRLYGHVEGAEQIVRDQVHEVFEQQLMEVVAGAMALKNRPRWNHDQFKQATSQEALTLAVMGKYHIVQHVTRSLGGQLGKGMKALRTSPGQS